ncbi:MAG: hypothetical protein R3E77_07670 [Steroidobacteraceae bacterium]
MLPDLTLPAIDASSRFPAASDLQDLDMLLVLLPVSTKPAALARLPAARHWQDLLLEAPPIAGSARSTVLGNPARTLAVLGFHADGSEIFALASTAARMMALAGNRRARVGLLAIAGNRKNIAAGLEALASASLAADFALPRYQGKPGARAPRIKSLRLFGSDALDLRLLAANARANNLARWLTALPTNKLDVAAYRRLLTQLARSKKLQLTWYGEARLRKLGAEAFLAVSRGSKLRNGGIALLRYRPKLPRKRPAIALVGKGIVFDTGGTNLKPHRAMLDMHTDMAGSAVALAATLAMVELESRQPIDCWLAITDNAIGSGAYRPQEIVRAANGVHIQVIHTDAEGRMALADTLALASRERPEAIIDFATLTGACVYALTERMSGLFSNDVALERRLQDAANRCGERLHAFPMPEDFDSDLHSDNADVMQCAVEGKGDHILAARFLSRFVDKSIPWAHIDLAAASRKGGLGAIATEITGFGAVLAVTALLGERQRRR